MIDWFVNGRKIGAQTRTMQHIIAHAHTKKTTGTEVLRQKNALKLRYPVYIMAMKLQKYNI